MAQIRLNGNEVAAAKGRNLLTVALEQGVFIPHLCFHPGLSTPAHCRMCVTEVELDGHRQLTTACNTPIEDGMVVDTTSPAVAEARESVLEFMLLNHPLDCPVCDKSGECELQEYAFANGSDRGRFAETRRSPAVQEIGERLLLDGERCIQCTRCVRFEDEISGTSELGAVRKGGDTEIALYPDQQVAHRLSGNLVDLCPVGAILDKGADSQPIWQLTGVDSICPGCSTGCNIRIDVGKEDRIRRLVPRVNMQVNEHWMCDDGRYGWGYVHGDRRLQTPKVSTDGEGQQSTSWDAAVAAVSEGIAKCKAEETAAVFSTFMTNEEAYLFALLVFDCWGVQHACLPEVEVEEGDVSFPGGFTIREDRSPNSRGVAEVLSLFNVELDEPEYLLAAAEEGRIAAAYVIGGDPLSQSAAAMARSLSGLDFLAVQDIQESELSRAADTVLPGCSFAEKDGTYMNCDGRVQRIRPAVAPPAEARPDWSILSQLCVANGLRVPTDGAAAVFSQLSAADRRGSFDDLSYERLDAREPTGCSKGQAFGGGWASLVQRLGFVAVEDHTKVSESWKPTS